MFYLTAHIFLPCQETLMLLRKSGLNLLERLYFTKCITEMFGVRPLGGAPALIWPLDSWRVFCWWARKHHEGCLDETCSGWRTGPAAVRGFGVLLVVFEVIRCRLFGCSLTVAAFQPLGERRGALHSSNDGRSTQGPIRGKWSSKASWEENDAG